MKNLLSLSLLALSAVATLAQAQLPDQPVVNQYRGIASIGAVIACPDGRVVADVDQSKIFCFSPEGTLLKTFKQGTPTDQLPQVASAVRASAVGSPMVAAQGFSPAGMEMDTNGRLVVADSLGNRLAVFNADGTLSTYIGVETEADELIAETPETEATEAYLAAPHAVAFGPENRLYVADSGHNRVAVFSATTGAYLFAWGTPGYTGNYEMSYPMGIAVANGKVYVADAGNARVLVYTTEGAYVATVGGRGLGAGQFDSPFALGVDGEGRLWVADNGAQKMVVFDQDLSYLREYGQNVAGIYFEDLRSIYVDKQGTVLTADGAGATVYTWETGVALARYEGKVDPAPTGKLADAVMAFGPVPARAGQTLNLQVPFQADELRWELYSADMRRVAEGSEQNRDRAQIIQTADLGSGVYMIRMKVTDNGESRESIQKIVITR